MSKTKTPHIELNFTDEIHAGTPYDYDEIIFGLDKKIEMLSSKADSLDYLLAIASGLLCASLDILWVGELNLERGRNAADKKIDDVVVKMAKLTGYKGNDLQDAVAFLERNFPMASDKCMDSLGGPRQHHLRDFAHHPTPVGLAFSLLTQFTGKCYGTDASGKFIVVPVPDAGKFLIGEDIPQKLINGTIIWFFHLVSDMAGSSKTAILKGGTGIPGPLLSFAKELSALPIFKNQKEISQFLSMLFNGILFCRNDDSTILRFDLRTELGIVSELGRQALPVIANECIVRVFYFIRRLAVEVKEKNISRLKDVKTINWSKIKPSGNPTIDRMLTIATGVFTTVDISAAAMSDNFILNVNFVGVGRFAVAVGKDVSWYLKRRQLEKIRKVYEDLDYFTFGKKDAQFYANMGWGEGPDFFIIDAEETRILYNLEYYKALNDIEVTESPINKEALKSLKREWLNEWKKYITDGFPSFWQEESEEMAWYERGELLNKISQMSPEKNWFRIVLLELMLFEPFYTLSTVTNKKRETVPDPKYKDLQGIVGGYKKDQGDQFIESIFGGKDYYQPGYVKRLRKSYDKVLFDLNGGMKKPLTSIAFATVATAAAVLLAGAFAPGIAVALVGSQFPALGGAALTNASLAFLGGGALAAGGAGIAGGTAAIIGGGAVIGIGVGSGTAGIVNAISCGGKENSILQIAKLLVTVQETILNDDHNFSAACRIYEGHVQNLIDLAKDLVEIKIRKADMDKAAANEASSEIKRMENASEIMRTARRCLKKILSAYEDEVGAKNKAMLIGEESIQLLLPAPQERKMLCPAKE